MTINLHDKLNNTKLSMVNDAQKIIDLVDGNSSLSEDDLQKISQLAHSIIQSKVEYSDLQGF